MRRLFITSLVALASACLSDPVFDLGNDQPSGSTASTTEDGMVRIPATTLTTDASVEPSEHKPEPKPPPGKGKDKDAGPGPGPGPGPGQDAGDDDEDDDDTEPEDDATSTLVPAFWIDKYETSVGDYEACVATGACQAADRSPGCTSASALREHPVTCITNAQAVAFCTWKKKRLLRLDEWIAATRGGTARPYPWGVELPNAERLNACGSECAAAAMYTGSDGFASTAPPGSFPRGQSPEGAFDLAGNVDEWLDDPASLVAGGSYADTNTATVAAGATRSVAPDSKEPMIGFRCARD